ncbi:AER133Cp [Eremothecium gossypii ATCC 10895]|uniref:Origin recognition complex subunit 1 n=1 Tax=Eremothecium gossypii (strain ATCC 10895 / CBS 109.51 / FGSC 9923 / NRRL Y-1056) TaxID=284811 RepID=Q756Y1_EREGS|nr:AER133Cp [Eremothecium gossypii ATCC 10895]AAS52816.2 AER133Cp [Eremothecium gossypii ATCC 10895]AEY97122.1 FAER133Cp [Eremothecium gossypii FDAG1]
MAATLADFKGWQIIVTDESGSVIKDTGRRRRRRGDSKEIVRLQRKSDGLQLSCADSIVCKDPQTNSLSIYMIHEIRLNTASNYVELWCFGYLCWYEINPEEYYAQFLPEALDSCPDSLSSVERADYFREKFQLECNRSELYLTAELSEIYLKDLVSLAQVYDTDSFSPECVTQENQMTTFVVSSACEPDGNNFVAINIREVEDKIRRSDPETSKRYVKELTAITPAPVAKKKVTVQVSQRRRGEQPRREAANLKRVIVKHEEANDGQPCISPAPAKKELSQTIPAPSQDKDSNKEPTPAVAAPIKEQTPTTMASVDVSPKGPTLARKNSDRRAKNKTKEEQPPRRDTRGSIPDLNKRSEKPSRSQNSKAKSFVNSETDEEVSSPSDDHVTEDESDEYISDASTNSIQHRDLEGGLGKRGRNKENEEEADGAERRSSRARKGTSGPQKRKASRSPTKESRLATPKRAITKKNVSRAKKAYTPFSKLYKDPGEIPDLNKNKDFYRENHDWDISALENHFRSPTKQKSVETIFSKVKRQLNSTHSKEEIVKASNFEDYLPARENEFATIYLSMYSAIEAGTGTSIYIAGTPGVGKTLTVREVVKELLISSDRKELPQFQYIEINGLKMVKASDSYEVLWKKISGSTLTSGAAMESLEYYFKEVPQTKKRPVVVLLDELDALVTKNQDVMYNFFNWTTYENSKFVVVAVANTMDLPERQLGNKVSSRIGFTRIMFTGYTHEELKTIINLRLMDLNDSHFYVDPETGNSYLIQDGDTTQLPKDVSKLQKVRLKISEDAVEIASRKIASVSGDARRALKVCKRAVEIAEQDYMEKHGYAFDGQAQQRTSAFQPTSEELQKVEIHHITKALQETITSPTDTYLRRMSFTSKLFLYALVNLIKKSGAHEQTLGDIVDEIRLLLEVNGKNKYILEMKRVLFVGDNDEEENEQLRIISWDYLIDQLVETGIIIKQNLKNERMCAIKLNISFEEVCRNIMEDEVLKTL